MHTHTYTNAGCVCLFCWLRHSRISKMQRNHREDTKRRLGSLSSAPCLCRTGHCSLAKEIYIYLKGITSCGILRASRGWSGRCFYSGKMPAKVSGTAPLSPPLRFSPPPSLSSQPREVWGRDGLSWRHRCLIHSRWGGTSTTHSHSESRTPSHTHIRHMREAEPCRGSTERHAKTNPT